jgi:hypothetical protein
MEKEKISVTLENYIGSFLIDNQNGAFVKRMER